MTKKVDAKVKSNAKAQAQAKVQESNPQEPNILEERPMPLALRSLIDSSNETLQSLQQKLLDRINSSTSELMEMLELNEEDGWRVDLDGQRFVKIELPDADAK